MPKTAENGDRDNTPPPKPKAKLGRRVGSKKLADAKRTAAKRVLKKAAATIKSRRVNNAGKIVKPKPLMSVKTAAPPPRRSGTQEGSARRNTRTATEAASGAKRGWRKLYIGDLPEGITQDELREEFSKLGELHDVWLARNPPGFGFVDFVESRDAARAVRVKDGAVVFGSKIKVEFAKTLGPKAAAVVAKVRSNQRTKGGPARPLRRPRRMRGMPGNRRSSPSRRSNNQWTPRSAPGGRHRRSPSPPMRRGSFPPPLPPLPPLYDPFDPRFREMALMGGWARGRSPPMLPPGPMSRFRSRSPSPPPFRGRQGNRRYIRYG